MKNVLRARYGDFKKTQQPADVRKLPDGDQITPKFQLIKCNDGTGLLFASIQMAVFCYKLNWDKVQELQVFRGHVDNIVMFHVDFKRSKLITMSAGGGGGQLRLWNIKTGEEILKEPFHFEQKCFIGKAVKLYLSYHYATVVLFVVSWLG